MQVSPGFWIGFNAIVLVLVVLDLTVLHRKDRPVSIAESIVTTLGWMLLAVGFGFWIMAVEGTPRASSFSPAT